MASKNQLWIDADGCPVVKQCIAIAKKHHLRVTVVKNHAVQFSSDCDLVSVVTVDVHRDAADFYIVNHMQTNDIVVTQDYGLSALVLSKLGYPITANGRVINAQNIDLILESRHVDRELRRQGKRSGTHKKRTEVDNKQFEHALDVFISEHISG
jgi:uncharacterized protein YaiI (UPF0178 family)